MQYHAHFSYFQHCTSDTEASVCVCVCEIAVKNRDVRGSRLEQFCGAAVMLMVAQTART